MVLTPAPTTTRTTGKRLVVKWGDDIITNDYRDFSVSDKVDVIDASAGDDDYKVKLPGMTDGTTSLEFLDTTDNAVYNLLQPKVPNVLSWFPQGDITKGRQVHAFVSSREQKYPYQDVVTVSVTFEFQGGVTNIT